MDVSSDVDPRTICMILGGRCLRIREAVILSRRFVKAIGGTLAFVASLLSPVPNGLARTAFGPFRSPLTNSRFQSRATTTYGAINLTVYNLRTPRASVL
jgi:hypothetical protein